MIAHASIPSANPRETAAFFAAVIGGLVFDFPVVPGASIAVARDGSGTAIEVYPPPLAHHPGTGQPDPAMAPAGPVPMPWEDQIFPEQGHTRPSGFHLAIATKLSAADVVGHAKARGWRVVECDRGGVFGVIEVWVDNLYLVEVLTQAELERYRAFLNPDGCAPMFGPGVEP